MPQSINKKELNELTQDGISLGMSLILRIIDWILVVFLRGIARYRFKVIRKNLASAFDYHDDRELKEDIGSYYYFLARTIRQIIASPSRKLLSKRMSLKAYPPIDQWLKDNKSIIVAMGHIGNWEWAGLYLGMKYPGNVCALYKQIKSGTVNKWMLKRRSKTVEHLVEISKVGDLLRLLRQKPVLLLMIADQNPGNDQGIIWVDFLGQKTAFANGPEALSIKYQMPVVYLNTLPGANGSYFLEFETISDGHSFLNHGEITSRYAQLLEKNIHQFRNGWLWSHKRWKREAK